LLELADIGGAAGSGRRMRVAAMGTPRRQPKHTPPTPSQEGALQMANSNEHVSDELWDEVHRVVNMTSRELREWLAVRDAGEDSEVPTDQAGTETGQQVLRILGKRRTDLTDQDATVMEKVVRKVLKERREDLEPTGGQAAWRHKLMTLGHDPLKAAG
jgi:hypothetical protein